MTMKLSLALAVAIGASTTVSPRAHAGELDMALGLDSSASSWEEDGALGYGTFKAGYRFLWPWFQLTYLGKLGYAQVDERMLTYLSFGVEVRPPLWDRVRPYARGALVHQHEEPLVAVEHQPFQSALGVGDGIRHRGGVAATLGAEIPFRDFAKGDWYAAFDLTGTYFPDDRGPQRYLSGAVSVGFKWDFARKPAAAPASIAKTKEGNRHASR